MSTRTLPDADSSDPIEPGDLIEPRDSGEVADRDRPALEAALPNPLVHVPTDGRTPGRSAGQAPDPASRTAAARSGAGEAGTRRGLWAIRDFRIFLFGQAVSAIGDAVTITALPLLVLALTGSGFAMGIVGVLQMLPDLILGLPAGALADRWDRRRMMLWADVGRAILTAVIPLSLVVGIPTMPVILLVTFPISALRVVFLAAYTGAVPNLVGRDQIGPANSLMEAAFSSGFIIGPGVAGVLAAVVGPGPTLALDALSFLGSAAAISTISRPLRADRADATQGHIVRDVLEGVRFLASHPVLRPAVAFWGWLCISTAALIPAVTFYVTRDLHLPSTILGLVIAAEALGFFLGAVAGTRVTRDIPIGRVLIVGSAVVGVMILSFGQLSQPPLLAVAAFGSGFANALVLIGYVTLRAAVTPDHLLGRVGSTARMVSLGLQPLGMLVAGILLDAAGGAVTLAVMGAFTMLASVAFSISGNFRRTNLRAAAI